MKNKSISTTIFYRIWTNEWRPSFITLTCFFFFFLTFICDLPFIRWWVAACCHDVVFGQTGRRVLDRRAVGLLGLGTASSRRQSHQKVHPARQKDRLHRWARFHHGHLSRRQVRVRVLLSMLLGMLLGTESPKFARGWAAPVRNLHRLIYILILAMILDPHYTKAPKDLNDQRTDGPTDV